jgi:hypothetical protein
MSVDVSSWNIFEKIAVGAGGVLFIFSFISSFVTASVSFGGISASNGISAWNSYATLGLLLCFAAVALVVLQTMKPAVLPDTLPWPLVTAGGAGVGLLLLVLRAFTYGGDVPSGSGVSVHPGWSGWIVMLAGLLIAAATIIPLTSYRSKVEDKLNNIVPPSGG